MTAHAVNKLDDPVVQLKGLVLVREVLRRRGTAVDELDAGIRRLREELAQARC